MRAGVTIDPDGIEWWALTAVAAALCMTTKTARCRSKQAGFPAAYEFGPGTIRWRAEDVRRWREEQVRPAPLAGPGGWQPSRVSARKGHGRGPRPKVAA